MGQEGGISTILRMHGRQLVAVFLVVLAMVVGGSAQNAKCGDTTARDEIILAQFDKQIGVEPGRADLYVKRGWILLALNRYIAALKDSDKALELDPRSADAYFLSAELFGHRGAYGWAIIQYNKGIALSPNDAEAYYLRGRIRDFRKESAAAIGDFSKALEIDPNDSNAFYGRGKQYYDRKDYNKAKVDFETGLAKLTAEIERKTADTCIAEMYVSKALFESALKKDAEALDAFSDAIRLSPTYSVYLNYRGAHYRKLGKLVESIEDLTRAIKLDPNYADNYAERALTYDKMNQPDLAAADRATFAALAGEKPKIK